MKALLGFLTALFIALPAYAIDVTMGVDGNLAFDPPDISISAGDTVHFVNGMLPPHNVVVEDHPELSHEGLVFAPGESFDITFDEAGTYTFWCAPHKGAGMIGTIEVS
jgi:plastocyanin